MSTPSAPSSPSDEPDILQVAKRVIECGGAGSTPVSQEYHVRLAEHVLRLAGKHVGARWALGWYQTKRHVVDERRSKGRTAFAICSPYTGLYPDGIRPGDDFPKANSDEVMAKRACKICERKAVE